MEHTHTTLHWPADTDERRKMAKFLYGWIFHVIAKYANLTLCVWSRRKHLHVDIYLVIVIIVTIMTGLKQLLLVIFTGSWLLGRCCCQDTGGPYTGTISVSQDQSSGSCIDNRGQVIQEGRLFEPGPDECQVCTCLRQLPVLCRSMFHRNKVKDIYVWT